MLNTVLTTTKIQLVTSSTADIDVHVSGVENTNPVTGDPEQISQATQITTATTTDILSVPGASEARNAKLINARNKHASSSNVVTLQENRNGTLITLGACTLLAGEWFTFNEGVFFHYDANGGVYGQGVPAATQADMEAGTSTTTFVTPGTQHFHPGHPKCWGKATVSGGTPTLQTSYNVTSITDTATDQLTVTIATDFSGAHYAMNVSIEAATTTLSATTTSLACFIRNATLAAGSFIIQACEFDIGGATDPSSWHWMGCGDL